MRFPPPPPAFLPPLAFSGVVCESRAAPRGVLREGVFALQSDTFSTTVLRPERVFATSYDASSQLHVGNR